jgi:hypothetical protein
MYKIRILIIIFGIILISIDYYNLYKIRNMFDWPVLRRAGHIVFSFVQENLIGANQVTIDYFPDVNYDREYRPVIEYEYTINEEKYKKYYFGKWLKTVKDAEKVIQDIKDVEMRNDGLNIVYNPENNNEGYFEQKLDNPTLRIVGGVLIILALIMPTTII